ncbi:MAG: sigma-54-dependent Fis family transcriptional regulator [Bacteroidetes bacterium]|nr:sigma-54-dependent Fis family transcriptional regulator [Bacteroidota bacterium]
MPQSKPKNELRIHLVEDDKWYNGFLTHHLSLNPDNILESFSTGKELLKNLYKSPAVVIVDYSLPDMNGADLMLKIREYNPDIAIIVVSGQEDISTAVNLLKEGASDYIVKNDETKERLWAAVNNIRDKMGLREEIRELRSELKVKYDFSDSVIGSSPVMKQVNEMIERACNSNITVSIYGETGTGKEVIAKTIHYNSSRQKGKFVAVNVASIPGELIESELFGHEKGAFTGAHARRIGRFEEADKGTLFLDEIAEMELPMQAKLLRVLQERELSRVGGNDLIKFDVRIIVATHKDLAEEVKAGRFREDLYYRLLGLSIQLPPLRERSSDIIQLTRHFIKQYCHENKCMEIKISPEAQDKLLAYQFPGNIRELKSVIELACVMCDDGIIGPDQIKFSRSGRKPDEMAQEMTLDEYNNQIILNFLRKYNNNVLLVAKKLNIGKSTIYRMLKSQAVAL